MKSNSSNQSSSYSSSSETTYIDPVTEVETEIPTEIPTEMQTEKETISEHPEIVDVTGMRIDTASNVLENRGFKVKILEEYSDTVEKGFVIKQIPTVENNLTLKQGDTVTITASLGKGQDKFYLTQMLYSDEKTNTKHNSFSVYDGEDYNDDKCSNALKFTLSHREANYPDEVVKEGYTTYSVSYDVNGKYKNFIADLTHCNIYNELKVEIFGDDKLLFSQGITEDTAVYDLNVDLSDVKMFTIQIGGFLEYNNYCSELIFNNAYFE